MGETSSVPTEGEGMQRHLSHKGPNVSLCECVILKAFARYDQDHVLAKVGKQNEAPDQKHAGLIVRRVHEDHCVIRKEPRQEVGVIPCVEVGSEPAAIYQLELEISESECVTDKLLQAVR